MLASTSTNHSFQNAFLFFLDDAKDLIKRIEAVSLTELSLLLFFGLWRNRIIYCIVEMTDSRETDPSPESPKSDSKELFSAESKSAANLDETSIVASTESVSGVRSRTELTEGLEFLFCNERGDTMGSVISPVTLSFVSVSDVLAKAQV